MATRDLCFTPAVELLKLYRSHRASPLEVMQTILARIDAVNPAVNAIVTLVREDALRHARLATAALRRGAAGFGRRDAGPPVRQCDAVGTGVRGWAAGR